MTTTTRRIGLATAAVAALATSFFAGVQVGRPDSPPSGPVAAGPHPGARDPISLANADLSLPGSCDALLDYYIDRGLDRVTPYGWDNLILYRTDSASSAEDGAAPAAPAPTEQTNSETGTNVQEMGVDEPDLAKTNGNLLIRADDDEIIIYDVTGDKPVLLSSLDLDDVHGLELLLVGDRVVAIGNTEENYYHYGLPAPSEAETKVFLIDVSDPADPKLEETRSYDADLISVRQHGNAVRLVTSSHLPDLDFVEPGPWRGEQTALERNRELVRNTSIEDWLPTVTVTDDSGESTDQVVDCSNIAVPSDDSGLGTLTIVGFDPAEPDSWTATGVVTASSLVYASVDRLYVATNPWCCWLDYRSSDNPGTSRLYSFAIDGLETNYVASGEVDGAIADRWSMDEADGVLRVAVGPTSETGNFNSVVTFAEEGSDLVEQGRVDKLGVDEQIQSVRWFDDLAVVVTFRQVDPLYAIDLSETARPRLLGHLKIPGFSSYLHPIDGRHLIGMGQDADPETGVQRGAQAALFDLADLTDPRQLDKVTYRKDTIASAGTDPRQFTWLSEQHTALTVISKGWEGRTGWISVLTVDGQQLRNRLVEVEYGSDVDALRLVPLPSGKVVLVTGDGVEFFKL